MPSACAPTSGRERSSAPIAYSKPAAFLADRGSRPARRSRRARSHRSASRARPSCARASPTEKPGKVLLDDEAADAAVPGVGIGLGEHGVEVADARVRDPDLAAVEHVVVAVAHRPRAHARRRRCRRRPPRGSTTPGTRPPRPAATYFCLSVVASRGRAPASSPSFEMNVNSDDDAQTRATSSTRDRVGEDPAALAAVLLRERPGPRSRRRATPPSSPTGTPRARRPRPRSARCASSASRRTDARSSSYSSGSTNTLTSPRYIVGWRASSGNWPRRSSAPLVRPRVELAAACARSSSSGTASTIARRRGSTCARPRARAAARGLGERRRRRRRRSRAAAIATSMSPITGARPNSAARLPAISATTGDRRRRRARVGRGRSGRRRARRACTRSRRSGRGCRAARPAAAPRRGRRGDPPASRAPAAARARRQVLLLARAGRRDPAGTNGSVGTPANATSAGRVALRARSRPKWIESSRACHDASMMFSFTPIVVQVCVAVGRVDQHPGHRAGALLRVEHAHLVVGEVHPLERREACR